MQREEIIFNRFLLTISITFCFFFLIIGLILEATRSNYSILIEIGIWLLTTFFVIVLLGVILFIWVWYFVTKGDSKWRK